MFPSIFKEKLMSQSSMSQSLAGSGASQQMVTAFFDSRDDAENAIDRIVNAGIARADIRMVEGNDPTMTTTTTEAAPARDRGFFESLGDMFMPDEDRHTYAEGLARGGYLVSVPTSAANRDQILDILDDEGTVNMDERESTWRTEGWSGQATGYDATTSSLGATAVGTTATGAFSSRDTMGATGAVSDRASADHDGTIDVVEERLRVGKRDVSHGRVRVRSYVVSEDVNQDVNLRSERVDIERRAVDRPVSSLDAAFKDQTIEMEETGEEAVVSKEARVKEEIDLNRVASERTQTISDTVRRTEVEIEDERTGQSVTGDEISRQNLRKN